jgi:hypothetical protein
VITTIDGEEYNTQTAECVLRDRGGDGRPWWAEVRLYLTSDGRWFLHKRGGPMTVLPQKPGGLVSPLTTEQARAWLEGYRLVDVVRQYFADHRTETRRSKKATRTFRLLLGLPQPD